MRQRDTSPSSSVAESGENPVCTWRSTLSVILLLLCEEAHLLAVGRLEAGYPELGGAEQLVAYAGEAHALFEEARGPVQGKPTFLQDVDRLFQSIVGLLKGRLFTVLSACSSATP